VEDNEMLIGQDYKIESEKYNIVLFKKRINEKKYSEVWEPQAYFSSLSNALRYIVTLEVEETALNDVDKVVNRIKEVEDMIYEALADMPSDVLQQSSINTNS
jgi:hypothetical protein